MQKLSIVRRCRMAVSASPSGQGFTLAEVLITLGIIGIVAAMTLPSLIQTNKNLEVETRLKKIYSVMNQAILFSEEENGPKEYWECLPGNRFMEKYIIPYFADGYLENTIQGYSGANIVLFFLDGSALTAKSSASCKYDFFFYPHARYFDEDAYNRTDEDGNLIREDSGITFFAFRMVTNKSPDNGDKYHLGKGFEPYKYNLRGLDIEATKTGSFACTKESRNRAYCAALIQFNNWKIPDDYPVKVR